MHECKKRYLETLRYMKFDLGVRPLDETCLWMKNLTLQNYTLVAGSQQLDEIYFWVKNSMLGNKTVM